ncbi:camp-regulated phosphoprotein family protein Igo1 [Chaetomium sp. MPI-SDFR-AT-0129]|nr:camp-regulated phosphoprotein family protein Igo1 [Chaetomium sp. MPI-SDFR-AT-0129]
MDTPQNAKLRTESDKHHLQDLYGKMPTNGRLAHHQLEGRKYFDSGDFALSQAHISSNIGGVVTGSEHPTRESVSHPACPVPSSSNVEGGANEPLRGQKATGEVMSVSKLYQEMVTRNGNSQGTEEVKGERSV